MEIYQILKKEHTEVNELIEEQLESRSSGSNENILPKISSELYAHMEGEEKTLYPRLEKVDESRGQVLESYEEHHVAKGVLRELAKMPIEEEHWKAKLSVMKELIQHHIEEEENSLFKTAKQVLDKKEAQEIGEKYLVEKKRIMERSKRK